MKTHIDSAREGLVSLSVKLDKIQVMVENSKERERKIRKDYHDLLDWLDNQGIQYPSSLDKRNPKCPYCNMRHMGNSC